MASAQTAAAGSGLPYMARRPPAGPPPPIPTSSFAANGGTVNGGAGAGGGSYNGGVALSQQQHQLLLLQQQQQQQASGAYNSQYHNHNHNHNNSRTSAGSHRKRNSLSSFPSSSRSGSGMSQHSNAAGPGRQHARSPQPPPTAVTSTTATTAVTDTFDRTSNPSSKSKTSSTSTGVSSQHSSLSAVGRHIGGGGVASQQQQQQQQQQLQQLLQQRQGAASAAAGPLPRRYNPDAHPPRKLRSQYPRGGAGAENHVEYILVASFDIDRGPVMEHQYPVAITGDENMLAELMLPDQAHVRNQDWTIFFLHKDTSAEEEEAERRTKEDRRRRRRRRRARRLGLGDDEAGGGGQGMMDGEHADDDYDDDDDDDDDWDDTSTDSEPEGGEGPPLIYVLNLVNTKQDKTVKRGAVVKAMAICTRHPFLHIYKPLLLLALEEYFKSPVPQTLELLYKAVNAMDLSLMPRLSLLERHLLQQSDNKDLFVEKFEQMIQMRITEDRGEHLSDQPLDASRSPPKPSGISRAGTKAHLEGKGAYSVPRDTHEFESRVMYKGIPIPIKVPVAIMPETVGDFSLIKLIQNFSEPQTGSQSGKGFPVHPHLTTSGPHTPPIIVLVNALLTQKRVIFLGHNMPSGEVAEAVLAACALASGGVLRGFTRHAFPYTDLTKVDDLLKVPGFIAGVTNPTFELHPEWWDVLCDLPSGRVKISAKIEPAVPTEGLLYFQQQNPTFAALVPGMSGGGGGLGGGAASSGGGGASSLSSNSTHSSSHGSGGQDLTGDAAFVADVMRSINARHGERVVRAKWRDWVVKFTRVAAAFEESVYGASALYIGSSDDLEPSGAQPLPVGGSANASTTSLGQTTSAGSGGAAGPGRTALGHGYVWADETAKLRELAGNVTRIEGWRNTRSYYSFIQDLAQLYTVRPLKGLDLHHMHDRLRTQRLTPTQSRDIYLSLSRHVHSYDEICLLLTVAPESHAGLFYVALGLLHRDKEVRFRVADLLERVGEHEAGQHWWRALSRFEKLAFVRIRREAEAEMRSKLEKEGISFVVGAHQAGAPVVVVPGGLKIAGNGLAIGMGMAVAMGADDGKRAS